VLVDLWSVGLVVLPQTFQEMIAKRSSTKTQQSGLALRSGSVVDKRRAKDGAPKRHKFSAVEKEMSEIIGAARKNSLFVLSCICNRIKDGIDHVIEGGQYGIGPAPLRKLGNCGLHQLSHATFFV